MWRLEFEPPISLDQPEEVIVEQLYRFRIPGRVQRSLAKLFGRERAEQLWVCDLRPSCHGRTRRLQKQLRAVDPVRIPVSHRDESSRTENGGQTYRLRSQFGIVEGRH